MEWLLMVELGTVLWYSYFASMVVMWFSFGMSDGKDGKSSLKEMDGGEQFWLCLVCTVLAPVILVVVCFGWFYGKGKEWGSKKQERVRQNRENEFGNEEGYDPQALDRLGVNDR